MHRFSVGRRQRRQKLGLAPSLPGRLRAGVLQPPTAGGARHRTLAARATLRSPGTNQRGAPARTGFHDPRDSDPSYLGAGYESTRTEDLRSEEHTSELQSLAYLVCRLLLEKKKTTAH